MFCSCKVFCFCCQNNHINCHIVTHFLLPVLHHNISRDLSTWTDVQCVTMPSFNGFIHIIAQTLKKKKKKNLIIFLFVSSFTATEM